ncbi:MAG: serine/threonine-protein kinase [Pirellulales bacterium]
MPAPELAGDFWELLSRSKLVPPEHFRTLTEQLAQQGLAGGPPREIAKELVRQGCLTRFQSDRLLTGQHRGFFYDHYKLLEILGAGGMGRLYVAEDIRTGERVALKLLYEHRQEDPGVRARFDLEARAGGMLNHPSIVRTHQINRSGHVVYIIMDLVEGISLQEQVVMHGQTPWPMACDIVAQAALGLQHAHDAGLVHRDVKPANLLITKEGIVKILDFGLARIPEDEFSMAMIFGQDRVGTADYVAPEQSINSYKVDARADIYSLGCTFYFALTGIVPFGYRSVRKTIEAHRTRRPRPVPELAADVPADVVAILDRMVRKRPEKRFGSAQELYQALAPFAKRQPLEVDFQRLLKIRGTYARKRIADMEEEQRRKSQSALTRGLGTASSLLQTSNSRLSPSASELKPDTAPPPGNIKAIEIRHAQTREVILSVPGSTLIGVELTEARLAGAALARVDMSNASLVNADLHGADMQSAVLVEARLSSCNLQGANLAGADLTRAELSNSNLSGGSFKNALLHCAKLRFVCLAEADLAGADLTEADLGMSDLQADFSGANLAGADLRGCNLSGANLFGANLEGANLQGAKLENANLRGARLEGAISPLGKPFQMPGKEEPKGVWRRLWGS